MCDVCCEKFNKTNRKIVECSFCDLTCCSSCCQIYILSSFQDPHCMKCKNNWNREFIDSFCSKVFRLKQYREHRENVLFDRERGLMPGTQPEVERIINIRHLRVIIRDQRERIIELHHIHQTDFNSLILHPSILKLFRDMERTYNHINYLRNENVHTNIESRTFIRQCPSEECKGFLNQEWFCGLCNKRYCKECNEILDVDHVCDPETVKTMELLNKDSKSCPKCGTVIHKTSGCTQMWCISCHTAFNWRTGEIETGRIHNPHFMEFKKKMMSSREHGDIPCGGVPSFRELREQKAPDEILKYAMLINQLEHELIFLNTDDIDNVNYRVSYMLNDITEEMFRIFLQRQEKFLDKSREVSLVYELIANACGDLLRQYTLVPSKQDQVIFEIKEIINYSNTILKSIRGRYNCTNPKDINI